MQKAVFFDRDGVINKDFGYVHSVEKFEFYDDFFTCASFFKKRDYKLIIITNQSGIQRGYYSILDFLKLSKYMQDSIFSKLGFYMDRIYFCPLLNDNKRRKPAPGMLLEAKKEFNLNMDKCLLVGDSISDIEAGIKANVKSLFLVNRDSNNITQNKNYNVINSLEEMCIFLNSTTQDE